MELHNQHLFLLRVILTILTYHTPSLYNAVTNKITYIQLSLTSGGTHGSGTEYTTGVTKSASYIETGTTGAFLQIVVASGTAPDPLFYYCKNHSGMGGRIETREVV